MSQQQHNVRVQQRLRIVQWVAWIDLILLVTLLTAALSQRHDFVQVLGPLHGINFLLLVVIVAMGALDGLWIWWFPVAVLFTGGAPGALVGEWLIKRRIAFQITSREGATEFSNEQSETEQVPLASGIALVKGRPTDERKEPV